MPAIKLWTSNSTTSTTTANNPATETSNNQNSPLPPLLQTPHGLAIIEIQGTLNIAPSTATSHPASSAPHDLPIARLHFPDPEQMSKKVYLYVGTTQRLAGEVKALPKPLAVVAKRGDSTDADDELEIVDIVRHKLFFGGRPEFV